MRNALVIIDMQKGFMNEHTQHLEDKIAEFIDSNRDKFEIIVGTQYINNTNTPCYIYEHWKDCMEGSEDTEIVPKLQERISRSFKKHVYSCWNQEFINLMDILEIEKIYFVGVNTGCCVLHSAFDSYNALHDCSVIEDLCGSTSGIDSHNAAIKVLKECITEERVIKAETFCD